MRVGGGKVAHQDGGMQIGRREERARRASQLWFSTEATKLPRGRGQTVLESVSFILQHVKSQLCLKTTPDMVYLWGLYSGCTSHPPGLLN